MFHDHFARSDQRSQFRVAEITHEAKEISVDRLAPKLLAGPEVSGDQRRPDAAVSRRRVQSNQPAFAVACDGHAPLLRR